MTYKRKIFIDTDIGNDDIMAIAYLLLQPDIEILGISTVNGVSTKNYGYQNIRRILSFLDDTTPVVQGFKKALREKIASFPDRDVERANNLTLLQQLQIPKKKILNDNKNVGEFIFKKVDNACEILAIGPLTNIASCIIKYDKKFKKKIKRIVLMGGGIYKGNVAPFFKAEYNIWLDPEAAEIVFSSKIPIVMVGIDATNCAKVSTKFINQISKINPQNDKSKIIKEIIINNDRDFDAFYDPLAASILVDSSIIRETEQCDIKVLLSGNDRGQTLSLTSPLPTTTVVVKINSRKFYTQLIKAIT